MFEAKGRSNRDKSSKRSKAVGRDSVGQTRAPPVVKGDTTAEGIFGRPSGKSGSSPPSMKKGLIRKGVSGGKLWEGDGP